MKFNVTIVSLEGSTVHHAFDEVRDSMCWSLSALGHQVSRTENWFSETLETNIIFGAELLADFTEIPRNSIIVNLEQSSHPRLETVRRFARGLTVWDSFLSNLDKWPDSLSTRHLPIGYTPNLTRIPRNTNQDIDLFFSGWLTPRRREFIEHLGKTTKLKIFASGAACYGGVRDELLSRTKLALNIHHDGRDNFEIVRCSFLMANSIPIVTEPSSDDVDYEDLSKGLTRVPIRIMPDFIHSLIASNNDRYRLAETALSCIKRRDFTKSVETALEGYNPQPKQEISIPIQRAMERGAQKKYYLSKAREINNPDPRVAARYTAGLESGDMVDFLPYLRSIAKGNVLEIGVRSGGSTSAFLLGISETYGHLYSIDVQDCSSLFPDHPNWTFIKSNSFDYDNIIDKIPYEIDVLLIDGDHSYHGVSADWEYASRVRPGGLVLLHDISPEDKPSGCTDDSWPGDGVKKFWEEKCAQAEGAGWTWEIIPGRYGLGVFHAPVKAEVGAEVTK